ncbi:acetate/propionate family kinase [Phnomibacter sp. MR]|uniref:acetate/propionate family kinase n=1 Tax=Phnomibacter sp. MR TaxID=3042318 RepID=UPI003A810DA3
MYIFVINSGSSSIKYQLFKMPSEKPLCSGLAERIGLDHSVITHKVMKGDETTITKKEGFIPDHEAGLYAIAKLLTDPEVGVISNPDDIEAVGHRVVHGGESFAATTIIDGAVKAKIKELFPLAPLHNPANYLGIEVAEKIFTKAKQVAVFDTAFHQTMPPKAYRYAIPEAMYQQHGIRAYGFHGTSHRYVSKQAMEYLHNPKAKIITIHLGNGCSMAAVDAGKSVDTSMGFGPVSGLVMGTRAGDIDASVVFHLIDQLGYEPQAVNNLLNKQSGMQGLAGFSDMREVRAALQANNAQAELASELYAYRIKKYIGAYAAVLNGIDAIVFTAGVGENDADTRQRICTNLEFLGIHFDAAANRAEGSGIRSISMAESPVQVLIVPTNEELEIVQQCYGLLQA